MNEWRCFDSSEELDVALAAHLASLLAADLDRVERVTLALSGGSTPRGMLRALAQESLPWHRVDITLVDERWVDSDSPDSNERMVREQLMIGAAADARLVGLRTGAASAQAGAGEAERRLATLSWPLTAAVLGMGADGHTASWFPGATNFAALLDTGNGHRVMATVPPAAPHTRMTLTLAAVLDSRQLVLHVTGEEKRRVLEQAQEQAQEREYPVASVLRQTTTPLSIWWAPQ